MLGTAVRGAAPAILLALAVLVPFADNAFTIDDTLFLEQATHLLSDPLHPTAFETVWSEPAVPMRMSQIMPSGPVAAWMLVPSVLAGGSEWVAHAVQLAALALAILATVSLGLRLGTSPRAARLAGVLLAATPAALAMAGTAMPDVMAMALGVAGIERIVAWRERRRAVDALCATILLGLAPLARSHLLLLLGVAVLLAAGDYLQDASWRAARWTAWLPIALAPLVTLAVAFVTKDPFPAAGDLASSAQTFSDPRYAGVNAVAFATHWVLALPLAVPWLLLRAREASRRWWIAAAALAAAVAALFSSPFGPGRWVLPTAPIAALGVAALADIFVDAWKRRDSTQLTLALWLLVPLPICIYLHFPSKYLLASAPAAALLVARLLERAPLAMGRWVAAASVVAGVALGVAILRANGAFADVGRRGAAELIAPNVAAGRPVWFAGNWGFKWYAQRAGGRILTLTPPYPARGHLVATSRSAEPPLAIMQMLDQLYPRVSLLGRVEANEPGGRTMSLAAGAGFFSNAWGYLPWAWGEDPLERITLYRIE